MAEATATRTSQDTSTRAGFGATLVAAVVVLLLGTRQSQVVPYSLGLTPTTLVVYLCLVALLLCWLAGQTIDAPHRPTMLLVLVGFLTTVLSSAALMLRSATDDQSTSTMLALVRESWMVGLVLFVLVVVRTRAGLENVVRGIVIGACVSAAVGLLAIYGGLDLTGVIALPGLQDQGSLLSGNLERAGGVRPQGMAGHPLELSAVLTVAFPLAVGLTMAARERGRSGAVWAVASALLLVAALSTISRSAVIGAVVALVVMAWSWPVRRVLGIASVALVGVLLAMATGLSVVTRIAGVLTGGSQDASVASRRNGLSYAFEVLPDHWWFGQGAGTYDLRYQPVLDNFYLSRTVESGLLGLAAVVALLVGAWCIAAAARRRFTEAGDDAMAELVNGIVGALTALMVIGLILDVPAFVQISSVMYLLVALAGAAAVVSRSPAPVEETTS